jgi:hypothetical protein
MLELLKEQLQDYIAQKKQKEKEFIKLMREGKEWRHIARQAAGLNMMIVATIEEIKKYL